MYICHFLVFKRKLFDELGGFRSQFDGSQDYDFMLRLSEKTDQICHIPRILYSWRESETSTALNADSKPYSHTSGKSALDEHLKRKYGPYAHAEDSQYNFIKENLELLQTVFIVSKLEVKENARKDEVKLGVKVEQAPGQKCERCWMYSETVGEDKGNPTICHRCSENIK